MALTDNVVIRSKVSPARFPALIVDGLIRIYKSALLNGEASNVGHVKLGSDTLLEEFRGIALEEKNLAAADNVADGDNSVLILARGCGELIEMTITDTITVDNINDVVYVNGDDVVGLAATVENTTGGAVGTIREFVNANKAWVQLDQ